MKARQAVIERIISSCWEYSLSLTIMNFQECKLICLKNICRFDNFYMTVQKQFNYSQSRHGLDPCLICLSCSTFSVKTAYHCGLTENAHVPCVELRWWQILRGEMEAQQLMSYSFDSWHITLIYSNWQPSWLYSVSSLALNSWSY